MKTIYDLLNDVKTDTEEYCAEEVSVLEKQRWKRAVLRKAGKNRKARAIKIAACIAVCILALAGGPLRGQVTAAMDSVAEAIDGWLSWGTGEREVAQYEEVINTNQESDGIEMKLESVFLDDREIVVSTLQTYPDDREGLAEPVKDMQEGMTPIWSIEPFEDFDNVREELKASKEETEYPCIASNVTINGQKVKARQFIDVMGGDEDGIRVIYQYFLDGRAKLDLAERSEIQVEFQEVAGFSDGKWEFDFTADDEELKQDTLIVPLDQKVQLSDGSEIVLTEYKCNKLGTYIYYEGETPSGNPVQLRGVNDKNEIVWFLDYGDIDKEGRFGLYNLNQMRAEDAESMTLTVYQKTDVEKEEYKPCGESFTIPTAN